MLEDDSNSLSSKSVLMINESLLFKMIMSCCFHTRTRSFHNGLPVGGLLEVSTHMKANCELMLKTMGNTVHAVFNTCLNMHYNLRRTKSFTTARKSVSKLVKVLRLLAKCRKIRKI